MSYCVYFLSKRAVEMRIDVKTKREQQRAEIRADLVAAAHALVKDEGYEGLTIRKLADRAGLATMSVYSYFADKQSILEAMAEDAFVELAKRCDMRRTADPMESLTGGLEEYVIFGLENPNEYRTVFMTPQVHVHQGKTFEDLEAHNPAFQGLLDGGAGLHRRAGAVRRCTRNRNHPVDRGARRRVA